MKEPRQILLERHEDAASGLDAIRESVLDDLKSDAVSQGWLTFLLEQWFRPYRFYWAGVGACWLVIMGLQLATAQVGASDHATGGAVSSQALRQGLETRQVLLTRWIQDDPAEQNSSPAHLGPRSALATRVGKA